jgi:hypothetical protein
MPDTSQSLSTLLADIERLPLRDEPDGTLNTCYFGPYQESRIYRTKTQETPLL